MCISLQLLYMPFRWKLGLILATALLWLANRGRAQAKPLKPYVNFALFSPCAQSTTVFEVQTNVPETEIVLREWFLGDQSPVKKGPRISHGYQNAGNYSVKLVLSLQGGKTISVQRKISISPPTPPLSPQKFSVCARQQSVIQLPEPSAPSVQYLWFRSPSEGNAFHQGVSWQTPKLETSQRIYVASLPAIGCPSKRVPIEIEVLSAPKAYILAAPAEAQLPVAEVSFAVPTQSAVQAWEWDFGDGNRSTQPNPLHEYRAPGRYPVTAQITDQGGCQYTLSYQMEVTQPSGLTIPGAFSPNGDQVNDFLQIEYYQLGEFRIDILDQRGQTVFASENPDFRWDGSDQAGQRLPEGEYLVVIQATDSKGNPIAQKGQVYLIR